MTNRYEYVKKRTTEKIGPKTTTSTIISTNVIPQIASNPSDIFVLSKAGDRLDRMAYLYYNDSSLWWYIAKANNLGKGTWAVPSGVVLRIPAKVDSQFTLLTELQQYNEEYR